jgi:DNA-binding Xre family transcriptional regulator
MSNRNKLRYKMIEMDINGLELCEKVGITPTQLSRILNNKSGGTIKTWEKIAKALECNVSDII